MFVKQFFVNGIAHSSYLVGGRGNCAIIDPARDIGMYIEAAKEMGMTITHILETHLHADFASGHLDLAKATGANIYAPGECGFSYTKSEEGLSFKIDHLTFEVIETPGHTPEHISYVVTDTSRGKEPCALFCGDTLFVGDVGRPDLFPAMAKELASKLYHSLHDVILKLPDYCEVYPAHGAGSLCGRAMGAKRTSTIGYERLYNQALQIKSEEEFVRSLTTHMPPAPDHFGRLSAFNGKGPALTDSLGRPEPLSASLFYEKTRTAESVILDIRSYDSFGGAFIPGSYHVDRGGNFATFAAWVLPPDCDVYLVADRQEDVDKAAMWLRRVGVDSIPGYLSGGIFQWCKEGFAIDTVPQISSQTLHDKMTGDAPIVLVDVRSPKEFELAHIEGSINIPAPDLRSRYKELDPGQTCVVVCGTGHRSSLGTSLLKQMGFKEVMNVAGGMTGYSMKGYSSECPMCVLPHGPQNMTK